MEIHILTLFPEMFQGPFDQSMVRRARDQGLVRILLHNPRDFTHDRHRMVDDAPYGGGPGMVMKPEPLFEAVESALGSLHGAGVVNDVPVVLLSPQGRPFTQAVAREMAQHPALVLLCGHYEGVDARVEEALATDCISIGDYVLTGGEIPAMVMVDAVVRLLPGVLHDPESPQEDSFGQGLAGLLGYPQYTRPPSYRGLDVPGELLSGDHAAVGRWRRRQALLRTWQRRPDLLAGAELTASERDYIEGLNRGEEGPGGPS